MLQDLIYYWTLIGRSQLWFTVNQFRFIIGWGGGRGNAL